MQEVHKDETKPVITRIIANQFYLALKKGDWNKIKEILQHVIGMPKQTVEASDVTHRELLKGLFEDIPDEKV